jgi:hypothetical protein
LISPSWCQAQNCCRSEAFRVRMRQQYFDQCQNQVRALLHYQAALMLERKLIQAHCDYKPSISQCPDHGKRWDEYTNSLNRILRELGLQLVFLDEYRNELKTAVDELVECVEQNIKK